MKDYKASSQVNTISNVAITRENVSGTINQSTVMESKPIISIIIPYHNEPKELIERCVSSILAQSFSSFEVIVIDDGSDSTHVEELRSILALKDSRVKVFHQSSSGVSAARNYGVSLATGQYIAFVDSDDFIVNTFLEESYQIVMQEDADLVIGGIIHTSNPNVNIVYGKKDANYVVYEDKRIQDIKKYYIGEPIRLKANNGYIGKGPVARLIKKEIAKNVLSRTDLEIGEDNIWNLDVLPKCRKVCISNKVWYIYCINPNSTTMRYNPDVVKQCEAFLNLLRNYVNENKCEEYTAYIDRIISMLKTNVYFGYISHTSHRIEKKARSKCIRYLYSSEPWSRIGEFKYLFKASFSNKIKSLLFRSKLLFFVWDSQSK